MIMFYFSESGPNAASHKEVMKLRKDNQVLREENNFLKLKVDLILDMVNKHNDSLSHTMRKPTIFICENKGADQLRDNFQLQS